MVRSHQGEPAHLTGLSHLHMNSPLIYKLIKKTIKYINECNRSFRLFIQTYPQI